MFLSKKKRIQNYLDSMEKEQWSPFEFLLDHYLSGQLLNTLADYGITKLYCYINNKINNNKTTCILDNYTDWTEMKYQIVETSGYNAVKPSYSDTKWLPMTPVSSQYVYALPDVTTPHHYLALFLMDKVGNVTEPFYIAKNNESTVQYWLLNNLLTQENGEASITPKKTWTSSDNDYTFEVKLPKGSI
ncbi:MAG: hypothetical protein J6T99_00360, partial [Oscillospiraceae bacterium]|nr:hypothetical protein [Oscillospiraceae bacterium]